MPFNSETAAEAGRKSKRSATKRVEILNQFFEDNKEKVQTILEGLQKDALAGDNEARKTYLAYCFGKPEARMDVTSDGEQILGFNYFPSQKPEPYQTKQSGTGGPNTNNGLLTKSGIV